MSLKIRNFTSTMSLSRKIRCSYKKKRVSFEAIVTEILYLVKKALYDFTYFCLTVLEMFPLNNFGDGSTKTSTTKFLVFSMGGSSGRWL